MIWIRQPLEDVADELQHVAETFGFIDIDVHSELTGDTVDHEGELDIAMRILALEAAVLVVKRQRRMSRSLAGANNDDWLVVVNKAGSALAKKRS